MWRPRLLILQPTPYCNISCDYCYLSDRNARHLMSSAVLEAVCEKILSKMSSDAAPTIVWHAGEPTVVPIDWYNRAYQKLRAAAPVLTTFSVQTNGVAFPKNWLEFLCRTDTRIGLSIDGPQRFHDARRKTRNGRETWPLVMKTLRLLQASGVYPHVISVLHPNSLSAADEFYEFYRDNSLTQVSFSIDEAEGAHSISSFDTCDDKRAMADFLVRLLMRAFSERYPLQIRDVERIARVLAGAFGTQNEQLEAWQIVTVSAKGDITTFSPDLMEIPSRRHNNFRFGNVLTDDFSTVFESSLVALTQSEIRHGMELCRASCKYFEVCGGGAPGNKMSENGSFVSSETLFCRLSIQAAADALMQFTAKIANSSGSTHIRPRREDWTAFFRAPPLAPTITVRHGV